MKVLLQKAPDLTAFLLDEKSQVKASATGSSDLEAIGRLVANNPKEFGLQKVSAKYGRPIEGLARR